MNNWTTVLEKEIPRPCYDRPFVCDGLPSDSSVLVVGENPGTRLGRNWWSYWDAKTGFNYSAFLTQYEKVKGKAKGTRRMLNRIRENGVRSIETNVYRNEKPDGAGKGETNHKLLRVLVAHNKNLKAVIVHGKKAQEFLDEFSLPDDVRLYQTQHFTRTRYDEIDRICNEIKSWSKI